MELQEALVLLPVLQGSDYQDLPWVKFAIISGTLDNLYLTAEVVNDLSDDQLKPLEYSEGF